MNAHVRARVFVCTLLVSLVLANVVAVRSAFAFDHVPSGPPDTEGHWAHCNIATQSMSYPASTPYPGLGVACQYGPTEARVYEIDVVVTWTDTNSTTHTCTATTCNVNNPTATGQAIVKNDGGKFFLVGARPNNGGTARTVDHIRITKFTLAYNTVSGAPAIVTETDSGGVDIVGVEITTANSVQYPAKPFPGGTNGGTASDGFTDPPAGDINDDGEESCGAWYHVACHFRNALRAVFVPDDWDARVGDIISEGSEQFPFSVIAEITAGTTFIYAYLGDAMDLDNPAYPEPCFVPFLPIALDNVPVVGTFTLDAKLPVDTGDCETQHTGGVATAVGLWGWRGIVRGFLLVLMYLFAAWKVIKLFAPNEAKGAELGDTSRDEVGV